MAIIWRCILLSLLNSIDALLSTVPNACSSCIAISKESHCRVRRQAVTASGRTVNDDWMSKNGGDDDKSCVRQVRGSFNLDMIRDAWGKYPVLIRQAFDDDDIKCWTQPETILKMACYQDCDDMDEEVEATASTGDSARLIRHTPGDLDSFTMDLGPFETDEIESLRIDDDKAWSVLLNDVDRYDDKLSRWIDSKFGFIPRWRRDDAQISVAGVNGGIGPHVDNYDVFLIQAAGKRRWIVDDGLSPMSDEIEQTRLVQGIDVSILDCSSDNNETLSVSSTSEFVLSPGDVLYLPPRHVHAGTALSPMCSTLSIGCRAPSAYDLVARVAESIQQSTSDASLRRYADNDLFLTSTTKCDDAVGIVATNNLEIISNQTKEEMKRLVRDAVEDLLSDDKKWDEMIGKLVTEPMRYIDSAEEYEGVGNKKYWGDYIQHVIDTADESDAIFELSPGVSVAQTVTSGVYRIFVDGELFWEHHPTMRGISNSDRSVPLFPSAELCQLLEYGGSLSRHDLMVLNSAAKEALTILLAAKIIVPVVVD